MKLRIHYEDSFKCDAGCGTWVNRIGQTCNACLVKAEERDLADVKARVRARLDPGANYDEHGRHVCPTR